MQKKLIMRLILSNANDVYEYYVNLKKMHVYLCKLCDIWKQKK